MWLEITLFIGLFLVCAFIAYRTCMRLQRGGINLADNEVERDYTSWAGHQVLRQFRSIPIEHRPAFDIEAIVKALDIKYPDANAESIVSYTHLSAVHSWRCNHMKDPDIYGNIYGSIDSCPLKEYRKLYAEMGTILTALKEREKALALAGVEVDLDMIEELSVQLRSEANIINQVTKEL